MQGSTAKTLCVFAIFAMLQGDAFATEKTISKTAHHFLWKGIDTVLRGCPRPLATKDCSTGRLLEAREPFTAGDNNSGEIITSQFATYDGLTLSLRMQQVIDMEVSKSSWPAPHGLKVGSDGMRIRKVLGQPSWSGQDPDGAESLSYCEDENCVHFLVDKISGRITKIRWGFYYD